MKYKCQKCNKEHDIYFGIKAGMSQTLQKILEENPKRVFQAEEDLYLVDKSIAVLPGVITINTEYETDFFYETWIKCDINDFLSMADNMSKSEEYELKASLLDNLVPYYKKTKELECIVVFDPRAASTDRAQIRITAESELKNHQSIVLTKLQVESLMNRLHHPTK